VLRRHRQVLILLVGLLYVYSVCPLLCAALEQKSCHTVLQKVLGREADTRSICCQSAHTGAASNTETPSESDDPCCSKGLELVFPDDRYNTHGLRESITQSFISILPLTVTLPVAPWESFNNSPVPLTSTFFPDHALSHRGPPSPQC